MCRTIHAIAAGAAMLGLALACPGGVSEIELLDGDSAPAPLIEPQGPSSFGPETDPVAFSWTSDPSLTPPPYVTAAMDSSHLMPPSASATPIPLPAGAWTGFASLAGLGTIAYLRHLRRAR
jgi:hypothetical protein